MHLCNVHHHNYQGFTCPGGEICATKSVVMVTCITSNTALWLGMGRPVQAKYHLVKALVLLKSFSWWSILQLMEPNHSGVKRTLSFEVKASQNWLGFLMEDIQLPVGSLSFFQRKTSAQHEHLGTRHWKSYSVTINKWYYFLCWFLTLVYYSL